MPGGMVDISGGKIFWSTLYTTSEPVFKTAGDWYVTCHVWRHDERQVKASAMSGKKLHNLVGWQVWNGVSSNSKEIFLRITLPRFFLDSNVCSLAFQSNLYRLHRLAFVKCIKPSRARRVMLLTGASGELLWYANIAQTTLPFERNLLHTLAIFDSSFRKRLLLQLINGANGSIKGEIGILEFFHLKLVGPFGGWL